jgi:hypothetical protein
MFLTKSIILGTAKKAKVFIRPFLKESILFPYRDIVLTGIIILKGYNQFFKSLSGYMFTSYDLTVQVILKGFFNYMTSPEHFGIYIQQQSRCSAGSFALYAMQYPAGSEIV